MSARKDECAYRSVYLLAYCKVTYYFLGISLLWSSINSAPTTKDYGDCNYDSS